MSEGWDVGSPGVHVGTVSSRLEVATGISSVRREHGVAVGRPGVAEKTRLKSEALWRQERAELGGGAALCWGHRGSCRTGVRLFYEG